MITVLDVDASLRACSIISRIFEKYGPVSLIPAGSGEEAVTWFSRYNADVIVSDHDLPEMTRIDLSRAPRSRGISLPFIIFSESDNMHVKNKTYREVVFGFMGRKGLERKTILNLLRLIFWATGSRETEYPFSRGAAGAGFLPARHDAMIGLLQDRCHRPGASPSTFAAPRLRCR